ncbi:hypothetical protein DFH11DRAFT_207534 [Phellopilus nigrolimitatus]|nr:hypothetical protein DFH11DRAFT_207534 [Phellopilus nigrolimitatus]
MACTPSPARPLPFPSPSASPSSSSSPSSLSPSPLSRPDSPMLPSHRQHRQPRQPRPYVQTQPKLSRLSLQGFLSLPRRLCAPPHAVGKVRSFGLTPIFDVTLDDVLDRKLLPPLSLKDFEEWLLFVEQCPENLYFIIWLREYTARYCPVDGKGPRARGQGPHQRREEQTATPTSRAPPSASPPTASHGAPTPPPPSPSSSPAPATPSSHPCPPTSSSSRPPSSPPSSSAGCASSPTHPDPYAFSPHPDPAVFAPLKAHIEDALRASLARCVRAAYTNVGTYRAACGICAGTFILLAGAVPPLAVNFALGHDRWARLAALPGLFFGLTILVASLRGCLHHDLPLWRPAAAQKFELERPPLPASPASTLTADSSEHSFIAHGAALHTHSHALPSVSIAVPVRPVRALTAPPKISIRIPTRPSTLSTPALSLGTTSLTGLSTDIGTNTDLSTDESGGGCSSRDRDRDGHGHHAAHDLDLLAQEPRGRREPRALAVPRPLRRKRARALALAVPHPHAHAYSLGRGRLGRGHALARAERARVRAQPERRGLRVPQLRRRARRGRRRRQRRR